MTEAQERSAQPHRVVIVGAGFGGLEAAFRLAGTPVSITLVDRPEVTTLFATVTGVDAAAKRVLLDDGDGLPYDTLILATGARHAYFGHDEWEPFAPGLKTLEDATTLRRRILVA